MGRNPGKKIQLISPWLKTATISTQSMSGRDRGFPYPSFMNQSLYSLPNNFIIIPGLLLQMRKQKLWESLVTIQAVNLGNVVQESVGKGLLAVTAHPGFYPVGPLA